MFLDDTITTWAPLGQVQPRALTAMRRQVRWAAQVAASIGREAFAPKGNEAQHEDWTHGTFEWDYGHRALVGPETPNGVSAALWIRAFSVGLLDDEGNVIEQLPLEGLTVDEALGRLQEIHRVATDRTPTLVVPEEAGDDHPLADGGAFERDDAALHEIRCWFENAFILLRLAAHTLDGASTVRCWPHELEVSCTLGADADASTTFGLRFGDRAIAEPYWFAVPWPIPDGAPPRLDGGGHWHAADFTGAVLPGSDVTRTRGGEEQEAAVRAFFRSALRLG